MSILFSDAVLMRSLNLFLILGSVAGVLAGAALLLRPEWLIRVSKRANHWVSTRQMAGPLARSIILDGWFYRYNRINGAVIMSGSIYIIYYFTAVFVKVDVLNSAFKTPNISPSVMSGLLDALVLTCLMGAIFAAIISLFLAFKPSMLREFEQKANQKMLLRQGLKALEIQRTGLDQYVFKNVRLTGILILLGSVYTLVVLVSNLKNF